MTKLWCSDRWAALLRQPSRAYLALQAKKSLNLLKEMPQKNTMICTNHLSIQTYQQTSTEHNSFSAILTESEVTSGPAACRHFPARHLAMLLISRPNLGHSTLTSLTQSIIPVQHTTKSPKTPRHNFPQRGRILHVHTF